MKVRDRTKKASDYKGRPTDACDRLCPCRPCFNPHDWGKSVPVYNKAGMHISNKFPPDMRCNTRENKGCPGIKPEPEHIFVSDKACVCKRCGYRRNR